MTMINHVPNRLLANLIGQEVAIHNSTEAPLWVTIEDVDESFVQVRDASGRTSLLATNTITSLYVVNDDEGEQW